MRDAKFVYVKRVAISGAAGFVASHLCDRLLAEGYAVLGLDNFLTGAERNIAHLGGNPGFEFRRQDVTVPFRVEGPVDYVVHGRRRPVRRIIWSIRSRRWMWARSARRNMLELAQEKGAKFLVTSTSESYGDPTVHPQVETYWGNVNPVGPRSCYDESKRFAEALTMAYHRTRGVRTNIARIFNTYGPRMKLNDGRVVPAFLDQALQGQPHDDLRRWLADAQFLLCQRSGGRALPADAVGRT